MKQHPFNQHNHRHRLVSLATLIVFLTLGFCPVRNALTKLVQRVPATSGSKVPDYGKIIACDDCSFAIVIKTAPSIGRLFTGMPPMAAAINVENYRFSLLRIEKLLSNHPPLFHFHAAACPVYLRNRNLLI
jgi:hypothetical protein